MRVLIVDDSAQIRTMLSRILAIAAIEVVEAVDGLDGLQRLSEGVLDAIMTDINMPRMDGLSFIEEVRQTVNGRDLPIFVLSSETCPSKVARAVRCGVQGWMIKPLSAACILGQLMSAA